MIRLRDLQFVVSINIFNKIMYASEIGIPTSALYQRIFELFVSPSIIIPLVKNYLFKCLSDYDQ